MNELINQIKVSELICHNCSHLWVYKGNLERATCPNCHYKVNIKKAKMEKRYREYYI